MGGEDMLTYSLLKVSAQLLTFISPILGHSHIRCPGLPLYPQSWATHNRCDPCVQSVDVKAMPNRGLSNEFLLGMETFLLCFIAGKIFRTLNINGF